MPFHPSLAAQLRVRFPSLFPPGATFYGFELNNNGWSPLLSRLCARLARMPSPKPFMVIQEKHGFLQVAFDEGDDEDDYAEYVQSDAGSYRSDDDRLEDVRDDVLTTLSNTLSEHLPGHTLYAGNAEESGNTLVEVDDDSTEAFHVVEMAEQESLLLCARCGEDGRMAIADATQWMQVMCPECLDMKNADGERHSWDAPDWDDSDPESV
ncbi:hypothetical protein MIND_00809100 [Mycena indigotica]|uniref:Uncharacterized protein n=1 Tax=Mycena indigotica TaxID=2126181 RepID=A0A8H6SGY9_9AGAR|nr:uncharacterized protein MIND_00809100 [Mycena indigotica]KAF7298620.1 hypothetical protein MIND_00809100 [Mycena indigotica]